VRGGVVVVARFSGVLALKTAGCTGLRSGVFGLDKDAGPETTRFRSGRETGVLGSWVDIWGTGGMAFDGGMGLTELDIRCFDGGELIFSTLDFGVGPLVAASLFCKLCTLRVRDSTFVDSFFLSLSILFRDSIRLAFRL
jgi:hypothetical protein